MAIYLSSLKSEIPACAFFIAICYRFLMKKWFKGLFMFEESIDNKTISFNSLLLKTKISIEFNSCTNAFDIIPGYSFDNLIKLDFPFDDK